MADSLPVRDPKYYIPDGNTVVLVEDVLFKVHRSMLVKDSSSFEEMFSLDSELHSLSIRSSAAGELGGRAPVEEGADDNNPICLQGDTAGEFRALLWSLYALPGEIAQFMTPQSDDEMFRFIELTRIAHKYQFRSTESWALQVLLAYMKKLPSSSSPTHLEQVTEVASLCGCSELLNDAVAKWKHSLGEGKDVASAIGLGERLGLKRLTGLAYHRMMILGRDVWDSDPLLDRTQRIRLLSGHYALTHMCDALSSQPPAFTHDPTCTGVVNRRCINTWSRLWQMITTNKEGAGLSGQVMTVQTADILGRLMLAESVLRAIVDGDISRNDVMDGMNDACGELALKATQKKLKDVQKHLVEYFSDVI